MIRGTTTSLLAAGMVVLAGASVSSEPQQDSGEVALETRSSVSRGMITVAPDGSDTALFVRCGDLRELTRGETDRLDSLLACTPLRTAELDSGFVAAFRRPPPARPEIRTVVDSAWVRRD